MQQMVKAGVAGCASIPATCVVIYVYIYIYIYNYRCTDVFVCPSDALGHGTCPPTY